MWYLLGASLSADKGRGDEGTGETTEIRRAEMDSLEIDEDKPELVAKAINRRRIINLNSGDDGSRFEMTERFKPKHMQEEVGRLRKKVPRWHHGHVGRGNRLLEPASLRKQKRKRQRHRSIVPVASTSEIGPVERAPGRRATAMVGDGTVVSFAVLSRVGGSESNGSVAKRGPGCKGTRVFATFCATSRRFATQNTVSKGLVPQHKTGCENGI